MDTNKLQQIVNVHGGWNGMSDDLYNALSDLKNNNYDFNKISDNSYNTLDTASQTAFGNNSQNNGQTISNSSQNTPLVSPNIVQNQQDVTNIPNPKMSGPSQLQNYQNLYSDVTNGIKNLQSIGAGTVGAIINPEHPINGFEKGKNWYQNDNSGLAQMLSDPINLAQTIGVAASPELSVPAIALSNGLGQMVQHSMTTQDPTFGGTLTNGLIGAGLGSIAGNLGKDAESLSNQSKDFLDNYNAADAMSNSEKYTPILDYLDNVDQNVNNKLKDADDSWSGTTSRAYNRALAEQNATYDNLKYNLKQFFPASNPTDIDNINSSKDFLDFVTKPELKMPELKNYVQQSTLNKMGLNGSEYGGLLGSTIIPIGLPAGASLGYLLGKGAQQIIPKIPQKSLATTMGAGADILSKVIPTLPQYLQSYPANLFNDKIGSNNN